MKDYKVGAGEVVREANYRIEHVFGGTCVRWIDMQFCECAVCAPLEDERSSILALVYERPRKLPPRVAATDHGQ